MRGQRILSIRAVFLPADRPAAFTFIKIYEEDCSDTWPSIASFASIAARGGSFESIDPTAFNQRIAYRRDIETVEGLVILYYNRPTTEVSSKQDVQAKKRRGGLWEATLVRTHMGDGSIRAVKMIAIARREDRV